MAFNGIPKTTISDGEIHRPINAHTITYRIGFMTLLRPPDCIIENNFGNNAFNIQAIPFLSYMSRSPYKSIF